jgi:multiple sugar transport system ATP-binding protein
MNLIDDGPAGLIGFRPEAFLPRAIVDGDDHVAFAFRVNRIEYLGADRLVYGAIEDRSPAATVIARMPAGDRVAIAAGERHEFAVRRRDIERFDRATGRRRDKGDG